jgi:O-antigen ligase
VILTQSISTYFKSKPVAWVYLLSSLFIGLNAYYIANEFYIFMFVPLFLLITYLAIFRLDLLLMIIIFFVPLSIPLKEMVEKLDFDMNLPTEPLLFGILVIFIFKLLIDKKFDIKILKHPISFCIYFHLIWMLITTFTSSMPLVSIKFFISRFWFIVAFYFLCTQLFFNYKRIKHFIWLYIFPLLGVISYTIYRHFYFGIFDKQVAHWVMSPFFNDHTVYAACLAMFIPILLGMATRSNYAGNIKIVIWIIFSYLVLAVILSYTRAAWLSIVAAFGVWILIIFRIKLRSFIFLATLIAILFFSFKTEIFLELGRNRQDSSADLTKHVQSISNISSDASNLERINRWNSALRMFRERPIFGWGPGTYMFKYAPFQFSYEKTIISTNAGNLGNAHSEYIGPLAESGFFGALSIIMLIITIIFTAINVYRKSRSREARMLAITCLLGLITYFLHGFLNNFLDTDKASAPFWGFIAIIVALDSYHLNKVDPMLK